MSKRNKEDLYRCQTINNNLVLAFHRHHLVFYDAGFKLLNKVQWSEQLGITVKRLLGPCIAQNFSKSDSAGFICGFEIDPDDISKIKTKSVYDECFGENETFKGKAFILLRLRKNDDSFSLEIYNQDKNSMIFKDEAPNALFEFALDKLLITQYPANCYIVEEW